MLSIESELKLGHTPYSPDGSTFRSSDGKQ
jgi:hypothetical protein